jgi:hypothetical protein
MNDLRMTSDPTAATSFAAGDDRDRAMEFARDYKASNFHSMPERVQDSAYGTGLVHLPTFSGDLWVSRG